MKRSIAVALLCFSTVCGAQLVPASDPSALHWYPQPLKRASPPVVTMSRALPRSTAASETLNDDTIIMLSRAGLGAEAVIAKINSSLGVYDTSTGSLIRLKQAGVPDSVIAAMLTRSQSPVLANGVANNSSMDPLTAHRPGIYLVDPRTGGKMMRIDATVANQTKSSGMVAFALTSGLAGLKMKTVIPNASARVQTMNHRPVFYFYFNQASALASISEFGSSFSAAASSPNEFSLIRFDQKKDHREAAVGSVGIGGAKTGVSDKARVSFSYDDVAPGVFKVMPSEELPAGQYGFVSSMGAGTGFGGIARIFDFAVG